MGSNKRNPSYSERSSFMSPFKDLSLNSAYDSGTPGSDVLRDFYTPVMSQAVQYDRLTGYFSSTILALAARGVAGLVHNGGRMRLVSSPEFSLQDMEVLRYSPNNHDLDQLITDKFQQLVSDVEALSEYIAKDHLRALAWMLREGYLEIRIIIPREIDGRGGIFHSKVGILTDSSGDQISFSGSINETAAAWKHNIEEFKVFRSWEPEGSKWVEHDQSQFERYWDPSSDVSYLSWPMPEALRQNLIAVAPDSLNSLVHLWTPEQSQPINQLPVLRQYQIDAVDAWDSAGRIGILEMATGTGKTRTALECIDRFRASNSRSLTVITAPFQHIAVQWRSLLDPMEPVSSFDSGRWRDQFRNSLSELKTLQRDHLVWIVVQNTASSQDFQDLLSDAGRSVSGLLLVADEAHGLGAPTFRNALNPLYTSRLGLTATPERWFDEDGSRALKDFFGGTVFEFGLKEALSWVDPQTGQTPLTPYEYHPEFVDFSEEEMDLFADITEEIGVEAARKNPDEPSERLELLLFKRAALVKTAESKIAALETLLLRVPDLTGTLIYCHNENQMNQVIDIVSRSRYRYRRFTGAEGTTPKSEFGGLSEREWILESFNRGETEVLIAMKCLDEGVDIPSARRGIILASSGNPREFIQRRGRLLRRFPGKEKAIIHDFVVLPVAGARRSRADSDLASKIAGTELRRIEEFSQDALNFEIISAKVLEQLTEMGSAN